MDEDGTSRYLFSLSLSHSQEQHKGHLAPAGPGVNAPSGPQGCSVAALSTSAASNLLISSEASAPRAFD